MIKIISSVDEPWKKQTPGRFSSEARSRSAYGNIDELKNSSLHRRVSGEDQEMAGEAEADNDEPEEDRLRGR